MSRLRVALVAALTLAVVPLAIPRAGAVGVTVPSPGCLVAPKPAVGIRELHRIVHPGGRLLTLTVASRAMQGDQLVNVLLPVGYDPNGPTRYPVLFLLHGAFGSYADWAAHDVAGAVGDRPLIVVMPDDGHDGSYSDWYGKVVGTLGPAPAWETYHVDELVPFVDATFRTDGTRFIAGLSSGGGGAMKYAAAHPGVFAAAGGFSGAVDTDLAYPQYPTISEVLWGLTLIPGMDPPGHCTWGDPYTNHVVWLDNDPTYLAQNLRGTALWLASGDGDPGDLDGPNASFDPVEYEVGKMNLALAAALNAAHVPFTSEFYGNGTHTWPYWQRDFAHFLEWLGPAIGRAAATPPSFPYRSARSSFSAWGYAFSVTRAVREFVDLTDVGPGGFTAVGSGTLHVTTPPSYVPGAPYTVAAGSGARTFVADATGRLRFPVDLGPSHRFQQYNFASGATRHWTHVTVRITP